MKSRLFHKLSGAGNDFVLVAGPADAALARRLCRRPQGVGADGLLALERRGDAIKLSYFNADGSRAFCGNGLRCAAWWVHRQGWTRGRKDFQLRTSQGSLRVRITGPRKASVRMPQFKRLRLGLKLKVLGRRLMVHFVDTGAPHAVVAWRGLDKAPVVELGRALRRHKAFAPAGANVDFVAFGKAELRLRTYERGVEDETLACGTGVTAAAVVARALGRATPPMRVRARSGEILTIFFRGETCDELWLEGPVTPVFSGTLVE